MIWDATRKFDAKGGRRKGRDGEEERGKRETGSFILNGMITTIVERLFSHFHVDGQDVRGHVTSSPRGKVARYVRTYAGLAVGGGDEALVAHALVGSHQVLTGGVVPAHRQVRTLVDV